MNSKIINICVGIALCILSIAIILYAEQYVGVGNNRYGPNFFPQVLAVMLFIASFSLIVQAMRGNQMKNLETINKQGFIRASITLGITIGYLFIMQVLGFYISTIIFLFVTIRYLGQKNYWLNIIVSIGVASIVYAIFQSLLKIPLPELVY